MKLDVDFDELFEEPADRVWKALTDPEVMADWLMPNDFEPEVGRRFTLWPDHETPWDGDVTCKLLELTPPHRMVWSWFTKGMDRPTRVTFELIPEKTGTLLRFTHYGDSEERTSKGLKKGWPERIRRFVDLLGDIT